MSRNLSSGTVVKTRVAKGSTLLPPIVFKEKCGLSLAPTFPGLILKGTI